MIVIAVSEFLDDPDGWIVELRDGASDKLFGIFESEKDAVDFAEELMGSAAGEQVEVDAGGEGCG